MSRLEHAEPIATRSVDPIDALVALAHECGAKTIAGAARRSSEHARNACVRLQHHLYEHHRALIRLPQDLDARITALTIARVLAENVLDAVSHPSDPARDRLAKWLAIERTKFLMANKADAVVAFDERLASRNRPRHQLRGDADAVVGEIVEHLLAALWERFRVAAEAQVATHSATLLAHLETSLGDLGELVPFDGIDVTRIRGSWRSEAATPSNVIAKIADRMRLASRKRIERVGRAQVVTRLDTGSRELVAKILDDYEDARYASERRFCELIDGALESARWAACSAKQAQSEGSDAVARARSRIEHWVTALSAIRARLD